MSNKAIFFAALIVCGLIVPAHADIKRTDFKITSDPEIKLSIRKVSNDETQAGGPILLVHGARVGAIASFDVDVPGYSLAEDLANAGHTVYLADIRGYGSSSIPASMTGDRFSGAPAVPTSVAVRDLYAIVGEVRRRHPGKSLAAMGWATGSHWLAAMEATHPNSIDRLVFYNSVYGGQGAWRLTELFAEADKPSQFNFAKFGRYRLSTAESLVGRWTKSEAISSAFVERYVEIAMQGDPTASSRTPASFRHPSGAIADTLRAVHEAPLYDASQIRSHVLILRSANDFWSRPVDVETFQRNLRQARSVTVREIANASHYVHLEPGPDRRSLLAMVNRFLTQNASPD